MLNLSLNSAIRAKYDEWIAEFSYREKIADNVQRE
jgi:hypothetical protein